MSTEFTGVGSAPEGVREAILRAALTEFEAKGFHAASMRAIADRANVSPAAAYRHFDSKQAILMSIVEQTLIDLLTKLRPAASTELQPIDRLSLAVELLVQFHTERKSESFVGNSELRSLTAENRERIVKFRDQVEAVFREIFESGVQSGEFTTSHPKEAARAVLAMSTSVANWYEPSGDLTSDDIATRYAAMARSLAQPNKVPANR